MRVTERRGVTERRAGRRGSRAGLARLGSTGRVGGVPVEVTGGVTVMVTGGVTVEVTGGVTVEVTGGVTVMVTGGVTVEVTPLRSRAPLGGVTAREARKGGPSCQLRACRAQAGVTGPTRIRNGRTASGCTAPGRAFSKAPGWLGQLGRIAST